MSKPSNEVSLADKSGALTDTAESESNWCDRSVQTNLSLGKFMSFLCGTPMAIKQPLNNQAFDGGPGSMKLYVPNGQSSIHLLRLSSH